ncbi:RepB family plasmid replication initiator protein [Ligilactobacillus salivarius]|uniref:RepB family plasmid replication initiator protein n=1 Tax=Ligilactobacillus salivarius TaxID=1624 RepID=UPI000C1283EA|nr:hypothetical protein CR249_10300 [Ligilactobacillus salivarius]
MKEINEHTEFNITYDTIRVGRKIAKIQFHISNNSTEKLIGNLQLRRNYRYQTSKIRHIQRYYLEQ